MAKRFMVAIDLDGQGCSGLYRRDTISTMTSSKLSLSYRSWLLGRIALVTCLFITAFSGQIHAQDFEGKNISEVAIRYRGAKTVDEARLRNLMSTKAGT